MTKGERRNPKALYAILLACVLGQAVLEKAYIFDAWVKNFAPKNKILSSSSGIDPQSFLFALAGFREMIAGILWVRADSFFDTGNYDAILPIIRLVTLLDPQEIDVYATGMWHIGYNFTDEEQRSDRRYIPSALALGKEGCRQNPETYELFFETGWLWYHKIDDDYDHAVDWFKKAQERPDMLPARKNLLGMALQRDGKPLEGLETYEKLYTEALNKVKEGSSDFGTRQNRDTLEGNIDTNLVRLVQRGWVAESKGKSLEGYDTNPPFDVGFSAKATVVEGHKIKFEGTWNVLPVGTRIRVVLKDHNMPHNEAAGMDWDYSNDVNLDPPKTETFMQDQLFVKNRRFNHTVDMSKDPTMYPFKADTYDLEFFYDPRSAPPHMQDKFSWNGEGMTDKNWLRTDIRPGQRVIYFKTTLTRDQLLRRGEWADKVPVVETPNYVESTKSYEKDDTLIQIPSLRSGAK
jgi:tetratricopeptide (TPR) repeat protein